jgi:uncharacterized protein (UPF0248 family)
MSFAMYSDDPRKYSVLYRDKDLVEEASLDEFMSSEYYSPIPITRVLQVIKDGKVVWTKGQKDIIVKREKRARQISSSLS